MPVDVAFFFLPLFPFLFDVIRFFFSFSFFFSFLHCIFREMRSMVFS